ncbi:phage terminase small subunit [Pontibacter ummariensis]|uniref:Phage terminase small subunit n=1 Tax=Pontibacter ummariensis TaxID=1610492 RepID=A0A239DCJ0_9BACT|nr:terminase small subunit [Pontibacter ummariensis]PRY14361.1 phage terminase small subunit [Pontibacter ummariensis]SNS30126.1 phage terminase small subunit [Pontibacter ummariensis]
MLKPKQDRFCLEYIKDQNATQAALRAGYSEKTAYSQGQRLLKNPEVQQQLAALRNQIMQESGVEVKSVVQELVKIAFTNVSDVLQSSDGLKVKPFEELTPAQLASIAEISETINKYGTTRKVKMHSKLTALDMLMKHLGGYMTSSDLIDKLPPERLDQLIKELLAKVKK